MTEAGEPDTFFLNPDPRSGAAFEAALATAAGHVRSAWTDFRGATRGLSYDDLQRELEALDVCPASGVGLEAALREVRAVVLPAIVAVGHPEYAAHLHSVPAIPALAAEVIISATNQSLDSFDQAPSATAVERRVIAWLNAAFFGSRAEPRASILGSRAEPRASTGASGDGLFTSGATKSNLMGLMLARDTYASSRLDHDVPRQGMPAGAAKWRILCSELAHFSVERAAAILGLGEASVVRLPADELGRLDPQVVRAALEAELRDGKQPIALVLTAGTTDLGSIDPLAENIEIAQSYGLWTHVDAAAGGAFVFSPRHRPLLHGIERADSIAVDFHKLLFQPISCGVFLVRRADMLAPLRRSIAYLDPEDGRPQAGPNLVGKSIETTRRFDALKVFVTMRSLGQTRISQLLERTVETAQQAAELVAQRQALELLARPMTNTVLLRWRGAGDELDGELLDLVNRHIPHRLWTQGGPVVGGTTYRGVNALKLTLTNPLCTSAHVEHILKKVDAAAESLRSELGKERFVP